MRFVASRRILPFNSAPCASTPLVDIAAIADFSGAARLENRTCDRLERVLRKLASRHAGGGDSVRRQHERTI
jgi:hypothetical protein